MERFAAVLIVAVAATLSVATVAGSEGGQSAGALADRGFQGEERGQADLDARHGRKAPNAEQRALARSKSVRWNAFGTPSSLSDNGGYLAEGLPANPVAAARAYLSANAQLFGLTAESISELEVVNVAPIGAGSAVLLRQRFDGLAAGHDGLVALGIAGGKVAYASSSLSPAQSVQGTVLVTSDAAIAAAAGNAGIDRASATVADARLVALPTPLDGVRPAWETTLIDGEGADAVQSYVDAENGEVLLRESLVDYLTDNPTWSVFPNVPPLDYSSADTRELWCWLTGAPGCDRVVGNSAATVEWDVFPDTGPTFTTKGNAARGTEKWNTNASNSQGTNYATPSPTRDYAYGWTNQWYEQRCNPATFTSAQRNDIDAATANLFAMHNRMHDWSYFLGFTEPNFNMQERNFGRGGLESDPEHGNSQAGGVVGGPPGFQSRDNANQITPRDGLAPTTNMYLWQPIAGGFYAPCVDGDYDMSVIAHEYTHAISNRMVAGPNTGISGNQGGAMGESWSDLVAVEYLSENGFAPIAGENPFAVGPYVTNDHQAGIRNYGMNASPLNYSDVGYDFACNTNVQGFCTGQTQVHADGEIWSAVNYDIRQALNARYGGGGAELQESCADGQTPVAQCPGNRRWMQLVFDAWLLLASGSVSMLDARDAMLAADLVRFGGANQDLLWNAFARRGFGSGASTTGSNDFDPVPSFESPHAAEAVVTFKAVGESGASVPTQLFLGRYEARVTPIADTSPATPLDETFAIVPGTFEFVARGDGRGAVRFTATFRAGQIRDLPVNMPRNIASRHSGATATGDGAGDLSRQNLIDDTEATTWASLNSPVAGKQVTVRLDPSRSAYVIKRVQVSAQLRTRVQNSPDGDSASQSRFSALRQFEILACEAKGAIDCSQDAHFTLVFTSPEDAFPAVVPRPRAPELILRSFDIPSTTASHVRLRVVANQCTGQPAYHGDQDDDPLNVTDCREGSVQDDNVRAAELQVFTR